MEPLSRTKLTLAAFRIYLTYLAHETKDQLRNYQWRLRISSSSKDKSNWEEVVKSASLVVKYIHDCRYDDQVGAFFARAAYGLCAID